MADPLDILSGTHRPRDDEWGATLANLAQVLASIPERRMRANQQQMQAQLLERRMGLEERKIASDEQAQQRAAEMQQGISRIISEGMKDGPSGKEFDTDAILGRMGQAGVPPEQLAKYAQSFEQIRESRTKHTKERNEYIARTINAAVENYSPEAVMMGIAELQANGAIAEKDVEPIYRALASDQDVRPLLKMFRDKLSDTYRQKPKEPVKLGPNDVLVPAEGGAPIATNPVEKTGAAPSIGSFEDYIVRKYGESPTPDQIKEGRKEYQQADDRPIRISTGRDSLTPNMESNVINRLSNQWSKESKPARDLERQVSVMDAGLTAARNGDMNAGSQAVVMTFNKILDPQSVVRESEFDRSAAGQSLMNRAKGALEKIVSGGAKMPLSELEKFAALAKEIASAQRGSRLSAIKERIGKTADRYKIPRELVFESETTVEPPPASAPKNTRKSYPAHWK